MYSGGSSLNASMIAHTICGLMYSHTLERWLVKAMHESHECALVVQQVAVQLPEAYIRNKLAVWMLLLVKIIISKFLFIYLQFILCDKSLYICIHF